MAAALIPPPGRQTQAISIQNTTPGDNSVSVPGGPNGSILDGSAVVHNHGPYTVTDFQISLREGGALYVLVLPGGGHRVAPAQGMAYTIHSSVPLSVEQLKSGKSFLLEAQLDGPPGLATDEESGTTSWSTRPAPPR